MQAEAQSKKGIIPYFHLELSAKIAKSPWGTWMPRPSVITADPDNG
jgi:hypothetical protein